MVVSSSKRITINILRMSLSELTDSRAYEIEKHWGKTAPPPEKLEHLSAKGGGIMTRPENWKHPENAKHREDGSPHAPGPLAIARCTFLFELSNS